MATAEGSSSPFWDAPENEVPRMERILSVVSRQPDKKSYAFFVGKSNNDNFVAYKWNGTELAPFWICTHNCSERRDKLNLAEELVYGINQTVTPNGDWHVNMRIEALQARIMNLALNDDDEPSLIGPVNNRLCVLEHAYVQMRKGLMPDVDWIRITGRAVDDDSVQTEVVKK